MKTTKRATHEWRKVPAKWFQELPDAEKQELIEEEVNKMILLRPTDGSFETALARIAEFQSYFPCNNRVPDEGAWVLVKEPPNTEYTVPPLSIWFAVPWPGMTGYGDNPIHRVKIVTPKGSLGLFPHEYTRIEDPTKYLEFIGEGLDIKFFGGVQGVPPDSLFYLRSRGIQKRDAIIMLLGQIKSQEVCWIEATPDIAAQFGMKWPNESRNAALQK